MAKIPIHPGIDRHISCIGCLAILTLLMGTIGVELPVAAQSDVGTWTTPVNISNSGGASQPVIAAAPDGRLHVLWWDEVAGEQYVRTTDGTGTNWSEPITVPFMWGQRTSVMDAITNKVRVTYAPPYELHMLSDSRGIVRAFWRKAENQLYSARMQGTEWGDPTELAASVAGIDVVADSEGTMHLVYVRPLDLPGAPSGVYYQRSSDTSWSKPVLVHASLYFRTVTPGQAHVSLAANNAGQIVITWDDAGLGQSVYARSADGGDTWTSPQRATNNLAGIPLQSYAAAMASGDFFLFWKDVSTPDCEVRWVHSTDGGQNWGAPERMYSEFSYCPSRMRFPLVSDALPRLLGLLSAEGANISGALVTLVAWDGKLWSPPLEASTNFRDEATSREVHLSGDSLDLAMAEQTVGLVGIDTEGDVWVMRSVVPPDQLVPSAAPTWDTPENISRLQTLAQVKNVPALIAAPQGRVYATWSEATDLAGPGTALYIAVQDGGQWSRPIQLMQPQEGGAGASTDNPLDNLAEQPALGIDSHDRLHVLWRGGGTAEILYSWTMASDAILPSAWAAPRALPMAGRPGSWPDLVVGSNSDILHAVYAVPYNEARGIYYVQSSDGGTNWSAPMTVFDAAAARWDSVDKPRLALNAEANILHAVWLKTALFEETRGRAIVYARSTDSGHTWSRPLVLAEGAIDWPRLAVAATGQVYVMWNQVDTSAAAALSKVWGQFSADGGLRWAEPRPVSGFEVAGPTALTSDGAVGLFLVGAGRGARNEATLIYSHWDGQTWSQAEVTGLGREAAVGNAVAAGLVPTQNRLEVLLRAFTSTSEGKDLFRVVTTGRKIQGGVPVKAGPTPTPPPLATPTVTPIPLPTATPLPALNSTRLPQNLNRSPIPINMSLVGGVGLIMLLIFGAVIVKMVRR